MHGPWLGFLGSLDCCSCFGPPAHLHHPESLTVLGRLDIGPEFSFRRQQLLKFFIDVANMVFEQMHITTWEIMKMRLLIIIKHYKLILI
jgi:hypothetical protein